MPAPLSVSARCLSERRPREWVPEAPRGTPRGMKSSPTCLLCTSDPSPPRLARCPRSPAGAPRLGHVCPFDFEAAGIYRMHRLRDAYHFISGITARQALATVFLGRTLKPSEVTPLTRGCRLLGSGARAQAGASGLQVSALPASPCLREDGTPAKRAVFLPSDRPRPAVWWPPGTLAVACCGNITTVVGDSPSF